MDRKKTRNRLQIGRVSVIMLSLRSMLGLVSCSSLNGQHEIPLLSQRAAGSGLL